MDLIDGSEDGKPDTFIEWLESRDHELKPELKNFCAKYLKHVFDYNPINFDFIKEIYSDSREFSLDAVKNIILVTGYPWFE
jgi:hypothetical protein